MTTAQRIIKYCAVAFALFLVVTIIGSICGALGLLSHFYGDEEPGPMQTYTVSQDVQDLNLDIGAASLQVVEGEQFSVQSNHKHLTVEENNGTLRIREDGQFFGLNDGGITVTLTIPRGFVFGRASLSTGAGSVKVDSLSAETLHMEFGAGAADIGNLHASVKADISGGTGKLVIRDGAINNLSFEIGVGKLDLTSKLTGDCDLEFGVGSADVCMLGDAQDYRIELDKGLGSARLDGVSMEDGGIYGSGTTKIDIDSGIGSLDIRTENR